MFTAIRLAKLGYFNSNPQEVLQGRVDIVESIIAYEDFESDLKIAYIALNKPE